MGRDGSDFVIWTRCARASASPYLMPPRPDGRRWQRLLFEYYQRPHECAARHRHHARTAPTCLTARLIDGHHGCHAVLSHLLKNLFCSTACAAITIRLAASSLLYPQQPLPQIFFLRRARCTPWDPAAVEDAGPSKTSPVYS